MNDAGEWFLARIDFPTAFFPSHPVQSSSQQPSAVVGTLPSKIGTDHREK
jgi:hypothetical protein